MFEWGLAPWLWAGLLLGGAATAVVAVLFVAGQRWFPAPDRGSRRGAGRDGAARPGGDGARDGGANGDRDRRAAPGEPDGGQRRRRRGIRRYLNAIDEPYREGATVEGRTVAFLLPERSVAVTFDAHTYLALRDSPVRAVLAEHEMPAEALGRRLPFDTPTPGPDPGRGAGDGAGPDRGAGAGPGPGVGPDPAAGVDGARGPATGGARDPALAASLSTLGFPADADPDPEELRRAYRARAKELHPDRGGDETAFAELADAYDTATDRLR